MSTLDDLGKRYPVEWLTKLRKLERRTEATNLDSKAVAQWQVSAECDQPLELATAMLKELVDAERCELLEDLWECPFGDAHYPVKPTGNICSTQRHSFTDNGHSGPIHVIAVRRAGIEYRYVGWLYALHGMASRGAWQEAFSWNVSTTYSRMVPVRIQKYGFITLGILVKFRQRRMIEEVIKTLRIAQQGASKVTLKTKPDVIAHSFGTWLIGHALLERPELEIGRLVLLGSALRPDFDWATLFRRKQVEAVLNHYGKKDSIIPLSHYAVPDAGPSGRRGFDSPLEWDDSLPDASTVLINLPQENFGHSDFFQEEYLEDMFTKYWKPFLTYSDLNLFPHRRAKPWPPRRWKPKPWPIRAALGGPKKTW